MKSEVAPPDESPTDERGSEASRPVLAQALAQGETPEVPGPGGKAHRLRLSRRRRHRLIFETHRFIRLHRLLSGGETVVVAVSGGLDSRVLLEVLLELRPELQLCLVVAHLHHGLRGAEADRDAAFVQELAATSGLPCAIGRTTDLCARVGKGRSLQVVARAARYEFLEGIRREWSADRVALAHTRSDQAETVLLRLLRGAGLAGLAGMPASREPGIIRPILEQSRPSLEAFANERNLRWIEDSSNFSDYYARNRVRRELIPLLKTFNPAAEEALARLAERSDREERLLARLTDDAWSRLGLERTGTSLTIGRSALLALDPALQHRVLRRLHAEWCRAVHGIRAPTTAEAGLDSCVAGTLEQLHVSAALTLASRQRGLQTLSWPRGARLELTRSRLTLHLEHSSSNAGSAGDASEPGAPDDPYVEGNGNQ